jgi:uncharacterized protein (TIGR02646 family)
LFDRNRNNEKGELIRPSDRWYLKAKDETDGFIKSIKNWKLHGSVATDKPKPNQKICTDPEIKNSLEQLFYGKCAYCEWKVGVDWDVEHFRPKGRVVEVPSHAGYYWLAYNWKNLYMACTTCNQPRKVGESKASGKLDQFPLESGSPRAMDHDFDLSLEQCLLIDPCKENTEDYIAFGLDGKPEPIKIDDNPNPKGLTSIKVFHWNNTKTNGKRQELLGRYLEDMRIYSFFHKKNDRESSELAGILRERLSKMASNEGEFSSMIRGVNKDPVAYNIEPNDILDPTPPIVGMPIS